MIGTRPNPIKVSATIIGPNTDPLSDGLFAVGVKLESKGAPTWGFTGRGKTPIAALIAAVEQMIQTDCLKMPGDAQR